MVLLRPLDGNVSGGLCLSVSSPLLRHDQVSSLQVDFEDEKKYTVNILLHAGLVADAYQLIIIIIITYSYY